MNTVLFVLGLIWVAAGTLLIVFTEGTLQVFRKMFFRENVKELSILAFAFGLFLVVASFFVTNTWWFVFLLGILGIAKGIYFFMAPQDQSRKLLVWWFEGAKPETIRFWGLLTFVLGMAVMACT